MKSAARSRGVSRLVLALAAPLLAGAALTLGGCSTAGPSHAYVFSPARPETVADLDPASGVERASVPAYLGPEENVIAFAYDPYTDHFFFRIFPGNYVRVVDRPARRVKRDFLAEGVSVGGRDFAIRSRDRHFFFSDPLRPALIETNVEGKFVRVVELAGLTAPVHGVAHDLARDELLVLPEARGARLLRYTPDGALVSEIALAAPVDGLSLGFDSDQRAAFARLADEPAIGAFDERGALLRRLPLPAGADAQKVFIDLGPRSLLRLF